MDATPLSVWMAHKSGGKARTMEPERNARIYEMRQKGMTLKAIGAAVGIGKDRVRQIVAQTECRMRRAAEGRFEDDE